MYYFIDAMFKEASEQGNQINEGNKYSEEYNGWWR